MAASEPTYTWFQKTRPLEKGLDTVFGGPNTNPQKRLWFSTPNKLINLNDTKRILHKRGCVLVLKTKTVSFGKTFYRQVTSNYPTMRSTRTYMHMHVQRIAQGRTILAVEGEMVCTCTCTGIVHKWIVRCLMHGPSQTHKEMFWERHVMQPLHACMEAMPEARPWLCTIWPFLRSRLCQKWWKNFAQIWQKSFSFLQFKKQLQKIFIIFKKL